MSLIEYIEAQNAEAANNHKLPTAEIETLKAIQAGTSLDDLDPKTFIKLSGWLHNEVDLQQEGRRPAGEWTNEAKPIYKKLERHVDTGFKSGKYKF